MVICSILNIPPLALALEARSQRLLIKYLTSLVTYSLLSGALPATHLSHLLKRRVFHPTSVPIFTSSDERPCSDILALVAKTISHPLQTTTNHIPPITPSQNMPETAEFTSRSRKYVELTPGTAASGDIAVFERVAGIDMGPPAGIKKDVKVVTRHESRAIPIRDVFQPTASAHLAMALLLLVIAIGLGSLSSASIKVCTLFHLSCYSSMTLTSNDLRRCAGKPLATVCPPIHNSPGLEIAKETTTRS